MDHDDDEPLPVDFHFYTTDTLLHNAKSHMSAERIPKDATRSGTSCSRAVLARAVAELQHQVQLYSGLLSARK